MECIGKFAGQNARVGRRALRGRPPLLLRSPTAGVHIFSFTTSACVRAASAPCREIAISREGVCHRVRFTCLCPVCGRCRARLLVRWSRLGRWPLVLGSGQGAAGCRQKVIQTRSCGPRDFRKWVERIRVLRAISEHLPSSKSTRASARESHGTNPPESPAAISAARAPNGT